MQIKKSQIFLLILGFIASCLLGYYISALLITDGKNTIYTMMDQFKIVKANPFANYWNKYSLIVIIFVLLFYFVISLVVIFGEKARRPGEEQGSSRWESAQRITRMLSDRSTDKTDPFNVIVFKEKKLPFIVRFFRNIFYKIKSRKAD